MQVLTQIIIISWELRSYENPQICPISSKIIPPSVTAEFQYGWLNLSGLYYFMKKNYDASISRPPWKFLPASGLLFETWVKNIIYLFKIVKHASNSSGSDSSIWSIKSLVEIYCSLCRNVTCVLNKKLAQRFNCLDQKCYYLFALIQLNW